MNRGARAAIAALVFVVLAAGAVSIFISLTATPPAVAASTDSSGAQNVTLQTVGAIGYGPHPTWVSYLAKDSSGQWIHSTILTVKANSDVHFTIYQYDSGSPLRNPFMDQVQGTVGGVEVLNNQPVKIVNDYSNNGIGHTFAIPTLGVSVPLPGVDGSASNFCSVAAPCPLSAAHNTVQFTIHVGAPGTYPWQCFVPCGLGFAIGNGGPMSTLGYMGGFLKVEA